MTEEPRRLYEKFKTTGQEKIKLACAVEGFFSYSNSLTEQEKRAYSEYLKRRIRPVMEKLIQEEDTEKMEKIEEFGWYGRAELDTFIRFAGSCHKIESLVWLMEQKDRKYGYQDRDFTL